MARRSPREMAQLAAHVDLYARALGVRRAAAATGVDKTSIIRLRKRLYPAGSPRLPNPGNTGKGRLSLPVARGIRAALARGERRVDLARRHGVTGPTIRLIERDVLYPEPAQ